MGKTSARIRFSSCIQDTNDTTCTHELRFFVADKGEQLVQLVDGQVSGGNRRVVRSPGRVGVDPSDHTPMGTPPRGGRYVESSSHRRTSAPPGGAPRRYSPAGLAQECTSAGTLGISTAGYPRRFARL